MKRLKKEFDVLDTRTTQSALIKIYNTARHEFIGTELDKKPKKENEFGEYDIMQIPSNDFKIDWDSIFCVNDDLRCYTAMYFKDSEDINIEIFSPQLLKKVGHDDVKFEKHLSNSIQLHKHLAKKGIVPELIGVHEKRVGVSDKEVYVLTRKPKGKPMAKFLKKNGGLIGIPILAKSKGIGYLVKSWGRQVLKIINKVQKSGYILRGLTSKNIYVYDDGKKLMLAGLRGVGTHDFNGRLKSAPSENKFFSDKFLKSSFLAPEYILAEPLDLTPNVDTWSVGGLLFHLMFGKEIKPFLKYYSKTPKRPAPRPNFIFNAFRKWKIQNGVQTNVKFQQNVIDCTCLSSYEGILQDSYYKEYKKATKVTGIFGSKELSKELKLEKVYQHKRSEIGEILDIISLCLQVNPNERPTI